MVSISSKTTYMDSAELINKDDTMQLKAVHTQESPFKSCMGKFILDIMCKQLEVQQPVLVVQVNGPSLLGETSCNMLDWKLFIQVSQT